MKKYIDLNDNTYRVDMSYKKDGCFGRSIRGYYLVISPVKINTDSDGLIISEKTLFDGSEYSFGKAVLLNEVNRKSQKQYDLALSKVTDDYLMALVRSLDSIKPVGYEI